MPLQIILDQPDACRLGGAHFFPPHSDIHRRSIGTRAETDGPYGASERPINLHIAAVDHRSNIELSVDEAEALIACLTHALALRRAAEASTQAKKAA